MSTTKDDLPDKVTPENVDELSEEEIQEINSRRSDRLRDAIEDEQTLSESERDALDALEDGVEEETERVEVNGVEVDVKTSIPGKVETRFARMEHVAESDPVQARKLLAENVADMIEGESYGSPAVWRKFGEKYGTQRLMEVFDDVAEPAVERSEELEKNLKSFRS